MLKKTFLFHLLALFLILTALSACSASPTAAPTRTTAEETTADPDLSTSKGLAMTLSADGSYYIVAGIGACTDTSIRIPYRYNGIPVKEIGGGAFLQNASLKSVTLSPEIVRIGDSAFYHCTALKSVTFAAGLIEIGENAFGECCALTALSLPDTLTHIADYAFSACSALTELQIPDSVTALGSRAFFGCTALTKAELGNGITEIAPSAFASCSALTVLRLGNAVTRIGENAFSGTAITTVALPITIARVESGAFRNCHDLKTVTYLGTRAEIFQVFFAQDWCKGAPESAVAVLCTDGAQAVGVAVPRP
jgi:hypothetical protein